MYPMTLTQIKIWNIYSTLEASLVPLFNPYFSVKVATVLTSITIDKFAFP